MWRTLPVCALLLVLTSICWGDDKAPDPNTTVIRLKLKPMAAPKPALKYQLLPELREMNPGNPILEYLRCFPQQHNFWNTKHSIENRDKWEKMPLKELPLKEVRHWSYGGGNNHPLRRADRAARLDTPDWQILLQLKSEGIRLLLPEVQSLREMASALSVRFRLEIAECRFDDALVTAKTMFALSRHLGEHPTLIGDLIAIAVASITIGPLDEMIQQPGCPNLYWALTDLPRPFIELRKGLQGDRATIDIELERLVDQTPKTEAQLRNIVERLQKNYQPSKKLPGNPNQDLSARFNARIKNAEQMSAIRKRLLEYGLTEEKIKELHPLQIVLLDEKREYEVRRDEEQKVMTLPYWQANPLLDAQKHPKGERDNMLLPDLFASFAKVKFAQARLDQRIALLRCVEALRIYAAEHDGKLPAKLEDIDLPLPVDPATGKSFSYKLEGDTAHLDGARLMIYQVRYEVTMEK
jgi:hypothetical protein